MYIYGDNTIYHCLLFKLFLIYKHTHTVFVNQVTFFCHSQLFWYKILNAKNREVCKIRKRPLILTINEGFLYTFINCYKRIDKHGSLSNL